MKRFAPSLLALLAGHNANAGAYQELRHDWKRHIDAHAPLRQVQPFQRKSALELVVSSATGAEELVRYPRLRVVDSDSYGESLRTSVEGINAVARLQRGIGAPAFMHLQLV